MASGASELVQLRRKETSTPWGFRMQGGSEFGLPLFIAQVKAKSVAGRAGLHGGDVVMQICNTPVIGFSHQDAKNEMMRAGNEVDFVVQRAAINPKDPAVMAALGQDAQGGESSRSELDEGSINPGMNQGTKFRNVTPKTYKILEQQLAADDPPPAAIAKQPPQQMGPVHGKPAPQTQAKPSSIFDRKKQDRSGYLVSSGNTIQKTFGEQ